jgi:membrane-associated phospholipid phosphatase
LVVAIGGEMLLGVLVKATMHRPRPHYWHVETATLGYSFPSAHAMNSLTFALGLILVAETARQRSLIVAVGSAYVILVGISRVWLGAHYPTDIFAGWTLALAWLLLVSLIIRRLGASHSPSQLGAQPAAAAVQGRHVPSASAVRSDEHPLPR